MIQQLRSRWSLGRDPSLAHLDEAALLERLIVRDDEDDERDSPQARHLATCAQCDAALARLTAQWEHVGAAAADAADRLIGPDQLARQFDVIARRLDGQPGRLLRFPRAARDSRRPRQGHRWVAMAAASGLIFGIAAGRLLGPVSSGARPGWAQTAAARPASPGPALEAAQGDERLLVEVDAALARALHQDFVALDALTPRSTDVRLPAGRR